MRRINKTWASALLLLFLNGGCEAKPEPPIEDFKPRWHFLAAGEPAAGEKAFIDLKCATCHEVSGRETSGPVQPAPELGSFVASQSPDDIATSIVSPSHTVSSKRGLWLEELPPPMVDYTRTMTVRQLMDVVAYLRYPAKKGTS